jgi:acyl-CoA synthetase (AMP-forming)/AMP-acid ligase II
MLFTWREVDQRVRQLADGLHQLRVKPGDRIAILMLNGFRYLELYYAVPQWLTPPISWRVYLWASIRRAVRRLHPIPSKFARTAVSRTGCARRDDAARGDDRRRSYEGEDRR